MEESTVPIIFFLLSRRFHPRTNSVFPQRDRQPGSIRIECRLTDALYLPACRICKWRLNLSRCLFKSKSFKHKVLLPCTYIQSSKKRGSDKKREQSNARSVLFLLLSCLFSGGRFSFGPLHSGSGWMRVHHRAGSCRQDRVDSNSCWRDYVWPVFANQPFGRDRSCMKRNEPLSLRPLLSRPFYALRHRF